MDGFQLGPIHIYWYSLCLLAAVWVGYAVALKRKERVGIELSKTSITDLVLILLIAGIVGGRLGYVVQNWSYYQLFYTDILFVSSGGLSIHGALVFGTIALWLYGEKHKIPFLKLTDFIALPLLAGQIIGRLGNFFNQELYGYPTSLPWKIFIDPQHRLDRFLDQSYYHPTFLYEMILHLTGFVILWRWQPKKVGQLTGGYLAVFSITRLIVEIFRISDRLVWNLSPAQIASILLLALSYPLILGTANNVFEKFKNTLANLRQNRN